MITNSGMEHQQISEEGAKQAKKVFSSQKGERASQSEVKPSQEQVGLSENMETMQRFKLASSNANSFSKQEMQAFADRFDEFRSKWGLYPKTMQRYSIDNVRSEKQIKNLFYNSLRKLATLLSNTQKKMRVFQKNKIEALILHHLINISYSVKDSFQKMDIGVQELLVFKVKDKIFDYCFRCVEPTQNDLIELGQNVRKLKFYLKNMKLVKNVQNQRQSIRLAQAMLYRENEVNFTSAKRYTTSRIQEPSPKKGPHSSPARQALPEKDKLEIELPPVSHEMGCLPQQCEYRNFELSKIQDPFMNLSYQLPFTFTYISSQDMAQVQPHQIPQQTVYLHHDISKISNQPTESLQNCSMSRFSEGQQMRIKSEGDWFHNEIKIKMRPQFYEEINYSTIAVVPSKKPVNSCKTQQ